MPGGAKSAYTLPLDVFCFGQSEAVRPTLKSRLGYAGGCLWQGHMCFSVSANMLGSREEAVNMRMRSNIPLYLPSQSQSKRTYKACVRFAAFHSQTTNQPIYQTQAASFR